MSLGIAKASGFPPIAGVYSAIVGGLLATFLSNARLAVKGPAAGLIVVALGATETLGYEGALACVVLAGLLQIGFALLRLGRYSHFFPNSAVHGLLASIGIIIIAKQLPKLFGSVAVSKKPLIILSEIPHLITEANPKVAFVGLVSLLILIIWPLPTFKITKVISKVPGPLVVLLLSVLMGYLLKFHEAHTFLFNKENHAIDPEKFLVNLPASIMSVFVLPNWSKVVSLQTLNYVIMFALIGSLESILSAKAVDAISPFRQKTNHDKDLLAVGVCNTFLGMTGGLPIITEIVRSSANINNGAKSRWANFFHGFWMMLFVVLAGSLINYIPVAALAAMLIFTGAKLASPKGFKEAYKIGWEQLAVFVITIIVTLSTDLLVGIVTGIITELILESIFGKQPIKSLFTSKVEVEQLSENKFIIHLRQSAVFSNYIHFESKTKHVPDTAHWQIDFKKVKAIDHTFMKHLLDKQHDVQEAGGQMDFLYLDELKPGSNHPAARRQAGFN